MKIHFPRDRTRRASSSRSRASPGSSRRKTATRKRDSHSELRDRGSPRGALDAPPEHVDEEHLEDHVHDVARDDDHERRGQVGDAAHVARRAEREKRGGKADRGDPQVRDGVLGSLALAAHQRDERLRQRSQKHRDRDPEREREPHRLRAEPPCGLLLARASRTRHLRGRPVLQEVEDREEPAEDRERDPERCELRAPEMADDRGVDEEVERLRRERAERRDRQPDDLPVVPRPELHFFGVSAIVFS